MAITEEIDDGALQDHPNRTETVYEMLVELLISGELRPGDVIVERKMAERLDASRTPVREALGRLEAERLVYKQPGRGVTVSPFSTEAFVEILNIRQLLEGEAAWLAAGEVPADRLALIRQVQAQLEANPAPTPTDIWEADDLLHGTIAEAAGNALMVDMIRDLRRRTHVFNAFRSPWAFSYQGRDNHRLLDAIERGERNSARDAMWSHIEAVKIALVDRLAGRTRGPNI
ncbi:GntR family transcriptional regulator [Pseudogemmobacter sonorensis]|uniref:GntR family transcriptional regulator n=1 Tax=Pseudogemmobacter sonorensis TaxID=2989681 RepID=UPI00368D0C25